ncbi:hypothetical protein DRH14_00895 [Candidatus Shapirobacteria bacterium]|nr:MAG: hypothetical protein DRH14_00895 [Candidatus Shapirobacteria bacterium]
MFKASSILKKARLDRELGIDEISKKLKIPSKYLRAIEEEDSKNYPQPPYLQLFVKEYADFFNLNSKDILSFFRRDYRESLNKKSPRKHSTFFITPQKLFKSSILILFLILFAYLFNQYVSFHRPPQLEISWPSMEDVKKGEFLLKGKTDSEATIRLNDSLLIVDDNGNFSKQIKLLDNQTNKIIITAISPSGATTILEKEY